MPTEANVSIYSVAHHGIQNKNLSSSLNTPYVSDYVYYILYVYYTKMKHNIGLF